jgi:Fic family protein
VFTFVHIRIHLAHKAPPRKKDVHPFEDGNGRIARAIADMTLARSEQSAQRFYSLSMQILKERKAYYQGWEDVQKGTLDITRGLEWFLGCLRRAAT